jgi:formaldehyde-activating enzyme involved in methanogenesis
VDPTGLTAGTYNGTVTITAAGASNSPLSVAVTFTVSNSAGLILNPTSLSFSYVMGGTTPAAQTFAVASSGAALTYTVSASGGTWLSATGGGTTPGTVSVSINPSGLTAGTYTGSVSVASSTAGNSPQTVAVTLTVANAPTLSLNPASLSFSFTVGGTAPAAQSFAVSSSSGALTYTVSTSGGSWLSASGGGTTPGNVSVSINAAGLTAGTYTGTVSVASPSAGNTPQTVAVTLNVAAAPNLIVSPSSLSFSFTIGGSTPAAQSFAVSSSGTALNYSVSASGGTWLSASGSGSTPGSVSVSINTAGLAVGTYTGTVSVASAGAGNSPQTVAVTLTVTAAPNLMVSPSTLSFNFTIGGSAPAAQTLTVSSSGSALSYSVSSSGGSWLSVTGAGSTPGTATVSVNPGTLAAGTYTGTVTVSSTGAGNGSQAVSVTLSVSAAPDTTPPTVTFASPHQYAVLAGIVKLTVSASDDVGVVGVSYQVDGNQIGAEVGTAPYAVAWDTSGSTNGIHTIIATARDAAGNSSIDNVTVQVSNGTMSSGGLLGAAMDSSTKFQVQQNGISSLISCVTCWFAGPSDLLLGQVLEVRLRAGASPATADVVILKQQTIDGTISQVGTNQFTLQPSATYLPTTVQVITGSSTNFNGVTPQVGQQISVRGILLKKTSASGGPTLLATIVELQ